MGLVPLVVFSQLFWSQRTVPAYPRERELGVPIVARDGKSVRRGDATGTAWAADGLSQDLFG